MKKILAVVVLLFFLTSCRTEKNRPVEFEISDRTKVYAYHREDKTIKDVYIAYSVRTVYDVFYLYTIYQNYLPESYTSMGTANVSLLQVKTEKNTVYYTVDAFIYLTEDLNIFSSLLQRMNQELGYSSTKIICNEKIIA